MLPRPDGFLSPEHNPGTIDRFADLRASRLRLAKALVRWYDDHEWDLDTITEARRIVREEGNHENP